MPRREGDNPITLGQQFLLTEEDIQAGITRVQASLEKYRNLLNSPNAQLKELASQTIPRHEAALAYIANRTPGQILGEMRTIFEEISAKEIQGEDAFPVIEAQAEAIDHLYFFIPPGGESRAWMETAAQRAIIATTTLKKYRK